MSVQLLHRLIRHAAAVGAVRSASVSGQRRASPLRLHSTGADGSEGQDAVLSVDKQILESMEAIQVDVDAIKGELCS